MAKKKEKTLEEKLQEALVPENQWPYMLPENWCWTYVEFISDKIKRGKSPKYVEKSLFPVFAQKCNQKDGTIALEKARFLNPDMVSKISDDVFLREDDIVINSTGTGTLGRVGFIRKKDMLGYKQILPDSHVTTVRGVFCVNKLYLYMFLKMKQAYLELQGSGSTNQKELRPDSIGTIEFPLPPLLEQKRIVHRIESLFAKLDEAKEKIQQVLDGAEMRKAAILHKAFTGELTKNWRKENGISEDSWESVKLKELGEFNRGKSKHRPRNDPRLFNGPYPFIQTGDVSSSGMYIQKHSQTLSEFGMQQSRLFPKDTLCITIAANIGKVAILTYDCCFPDSVVGFTPNERTFSKYMYYSMLKIQKEIEALAPAVAQKNLSLKLLLDVNVQIPSVEEQHAIVKIIERLLKHEKNVISASMRSIESIETMKKSILAKAFRGELGTNNPTEDSALNLLKEVLQDKS